MTWPGKPIQVIRGHPLYAVALVRNRPKPSYVKTLLGLRSHKLT